MSVLLPLPLDVKKAVFPFLANSIEYAHKCVPARWGLTPRTGDGLIRLNVCFTEVLAIGPEFVRVIVNQGIAKDVPAIKSGKLFMEGGNENQDDCLKSSPGSRLVEVSRGKNLQRYLEQLQEAHHENIRVTAKRGLGRSVKSAHSNDAILEIAREVRRELPRPLYSYDEQVDNIQNDSSLLRMEGAKKLFWSPRYERDSKNREAAKKLHGVTCRACEFNFESFYGEHGFEYIQVHHLQPLSESGKEVLVNPATDLDVVCANCHAMIHRDKTHTLSLDELKEMIAKQRDQKTNTGSK